MDVICIGGINIDLIARLERFPEVDEETVIRKLEMVGGGSAANVACGLSRLGVKTGFVGNLGDDYFGDFLLTEMEKEGVDTSHLKRHSESSGTVIALVGGGGERILLAYPGANARLSREDIDRDYIGNSRYLFLSSVEGEEAILAMELASYYARRSGSKIFFDPGSIFVEKGLDKLIGILSQTTILKLSAVEMKNLSKGQEIFSVAKTFMNYGPEIVIVTLGEKGAFVCSKSGEKFIDTYSKFMVIDKTGAGDAFSCGFIFGDLNGWGLEKSVRLGNLVASISVSKVGGRSIPYIRELETYKEYRELLQE